MGDKAWNAEANEWKVREEEPKLETPVKPPGMPPPLPVQVVPVRAVLDILDQVGGLYRGSLDVERYAAHVADRVLAAATTVKPIVSVEVCEAEGIKS